MSGARANPVDSDGRTPLSFTAERGHAAVVKLRDDIELKGRLRGHAIVVCCTTPW
jgi:hypothetical protein